MRFGNSSSSSGSLFSGGLFGGPHPQKEPSTCSTALRLCAPMRFDILLCLHMLHDVIQGQVLLVVCSVAVALNCHSRQSKADGLPAQALHLVSPRQGMILAAISAQW